MKILFLMMTLMVSTGAYGEQNLPDYIQQDNIQYERCNQFTFRYGFVIKVADIGWYAPDCNEISLLDSGDKILRFHYFKDVKADFFKESAEEYFLLNLDTALQQKNLIEPLKQFNNGYTDIQSGEYFQLVHVNDDQLSLYRNDHLLATTDNVDLAHMYFNIWFGKEPVIEKLKTAFQ